MPKKSKTYNHPALARFLKRNDACDDMADDALAFASRYPTLEAAAKACRGDTGHARLDWLAWTGDADACEEAYQKAKAKRDLEYANADEWNAFSRECVRAYRRVAIAVAAKLDRAVTRGKRAAATRAANRSFVAA